MKMENIEQHVQNEEIDSKMIPNIQNGDLSGKSALDIMNILEKQAREQAVSQKHFSTVNTLQDSQRTSQMRQRKEDENINYFKIEGLPTKGLLYPEGTEIVGRPLKVLDIKRLSSINENNADFIINDILKRTIRGIDINDLYAADKLYIVFWLRANTYRDSSYRVEYVCPKCEKKTSYHFQLSAMDVNYIKDDYDPNRKIKLENGSEIILRYLKVSDEHNISRFIEINSNVIGEIDIELLGLASMISSIDEKELTLLEKYYFVLDSMTPGDFSYINSYVKKYGIGIEPYMNIECKECGGTSPIGVTFRPEFFIPVCEVA